MGLDGFPFAAALALALAAPLRAEGSLKESHFSRGWATILEDPAPAPATPAPPEEEEPVHPEYAPAVHAFIARQAFELFDSQFPGTDLSLYIGGEAQAESSSDDSVAEGAHDEDMPYDNPFHEAVSEARHFWDWRGGPYKGLKKYDSAVNRANKYLTGGFGLDGEYDPRWSEGVGRKKGRRGEGALYLYANGDKKKAFWYLGHAAHLLMDMSVPAHVHVWAHVFPKDSYEWYIRGHHPQWAGSASGAVESFDGLYPLFLETAKTAQGFDCGWKEGGKSGSVDQGRRRAGGFTEEELRQEADVLMPLAIRRTAALYRYFYSQAASAASSRISH